MTQNPQPTSYQIRLVASRSLSPFEEEERDLAVRALLPEMDVENPVFLSISSAAVSIPIGEAADRAVSFSSESRGVGQERTLLDSSGSGSPHHLSHFLICL